MLRNCCTLQVQYATSLVWIVANRFFWPERLHDRMHQLSLARGVIVVGNRKKVEEFLAGRRSYARQIFTSQELVLMRNKRFSSPLPLDKGLTIMNHHVVSHEQIISIAQNALPSVTTVLVCQNTVIRTGISHILAGTHFVISDEAVEQTPELPALCLIHADLTAGELAESVERLKAQWPSARVVLLTESIGPAASELARQGGLDGLCSTAMGREALIKALELVMLGESFVSSAFVVSLLDEASRPRDVQPDDAVTVFPTVPAIASKLSEREAQILSHLTQGASNKHIARDLGVAEATVKVHVKSILRKVKAANRTQAAMWAQQQMKRAANDGILAAAE